MTNPVTRDILYTDIKMHKIAYGLVTLLVIGIIVASTRNLQFSEFKGVGTLGSTCAMGAGCLLFVVTLIVALRRASLPKLDGDNIIKGHIALIEGQYLACVATNAAHSYGRRNEGHLLITAEQQSNAIAFGPYEKFTAKIKREMQGTPLPKSILKEALQLELGHPRNLDASENLQDLRRELGRFKNDNPYEYLIYLNEKNETRYATYSEENLSEPPQLFGLAPCHKARVLSIDFLKLRAKNRALMQGNL